MHNLFDDRFYSLREPAWHKLGLVSDVPMGAQDALARIGAYDLHLETLITSTGKVIPYKAIYRDPTPNDNVERFFNIVGSEYVLITPQNVCEVWDDYVHAPIETMGILGKGEQLFMTTHLSDINIKGDPIKNYLLGYFPYSGFEAINFAITGLRVVCNNTLVAGRAIASETIKIIHNETAKDRMIASLSGIIERANKRVELLTQAYSMFSEHHITKEEQLHVHEKVYPIPAPYKASALLNAADNQTRKERNEYDIKWYGEARNLVDGLFAGKLTGHCDATNGTAWGLYNAYVEFSDQRYSKNDQVRAERAIWGWDSSIKEKAYNELVKVCR